MDGRAHRNSTPNTSEWSSACGISAMSAVPSRGNTANVVPAIVACSFQLVMPARIDLRDSRAPCRKNNVAMAIRPNAWKIRALVPWQGSKVATVTVPASAKRTRRDGAA